MDLCEDRPDVIDVRSFAACIRLLKLGDYLIPDEAALNCEPLIVTCVLGDPCCHLVRR